MYLRDQVHHAGFGNRRLVVQTLFDPSGATPQVQHLRQAYDAGGRLTAAWSEEITTPTAPPRSWADGAAAWWYGNPPIFGSGQK